MPQQLIVTVMLLQECLALLQKQESLLSHLMLGLVRQACLTA